MTIPTLLHNMNARAKTSRLQNIQLKLEQGLTLMNQGVSLKGYSTTEDFVKALSRYMKITTICPNSEAYKCWPMATAGIDVTGKNSLVNVQNDIKDPASFGLNSTKYKDIAGFITADGVPYIVSYDTTCSTDENKRDLESTCLSGIYDYNGGTQPNKFISVNFSNIKQSVSQDIYLLGETSKIGGQEVSQYVFSDGKRTIGTGFQANNGGTCNELGISGCFISNNYYWVGAMKICKERNATLPTLDELAELANIVYGTKHITAKTGYVGSQTVDGVALLSAMIPSTKGKSWIDIWSSHFNGDAAYDRLFTPSQTYYSYGRNESLMYGLCIGD